MLTGIEEEVAWGQIAGVLLYVVDGVVVMLEAADEAVEVFCLPHTTSAMEQGIDLACGISFEAMHHLLYGYAIECLDDGMHVVGHDDKGVYTSLMEVDVAK